MGSVSRVTLNPKPQPILKGGCFDFCLFSKTGRQQLGSCQDSSSRSASMERLAHMEHATHR